MYHYHGKHEVCYVYKKLGIVALSKAKSCELPFTTKLDIVAVAFSLKSHLIHPFE